MSVSLSLPSMHRIFILCCPHLQLVPRAISAPPTVPRPIHGRLFKMGVYYKDRAFTLGVYSRRVFNQVNTVYDYSQGVIQGNGDILSLAPTPPPLKFALRVL